MSGLWLAPGFSCLCSVVVQAVDAHQLLFHGWFGIGRAKSGHFGRLIDDFDTATQPSLSCFNSTLCKQ